MTAAKDSLLREKGFGFFGAITASLSHQMNNVLATINELSGLLDDFFLAAEAGKELNPERLRRSTARIATQVERGQAYVKRLNRFAHTVDDRFVAFEVRDALEALELLCRRFAVLKRAGLELDLGDAKPVLDGCVFDFQHLVYRCLRIVIDTVEEGGTVRMELAEEGDGARVVVINPSPLAQEADCGAEVEFLNLLASELQGQLDVELTINEPVKIGLSLPRSLRPAETA